MKVRHGMNLLPSAGAIWQRGKALFTKGFFFDRPLLLIQSDDWGRVGVRDREGFEELREAGLSLGENPYDFYALETSEDVDALTTVLHNHKDSILRSAVAAMYFVVANVDFTKAAQANSGEIHLRPLADGLPGGWSRPGLLQAYRRGVAEGLIFPALHGTSHFCRNAVQRELTAGDGRAQFLRTLWKAQTPYIFWRMPWVGYEYWDPERPAETRHLPADLQLAMITEGVRHFQSVFGSAPLSACAPGYRADANTHQAWRAAGVKIAQSGPGPIRPPRFDRYGILNVYRNIEFEPAVDPHFSVEKCLRSAAECFAQGVPAVLSTHSINFHSSIKPFRSSTLRFMHEFLTELERRHPDLLYIHDADLYDLITRGQYQAGSGTVKVKVRQRNVHLARIAAG
jgi:hypothetical protein